MGLDLDISPISTISNDEGRLKQRRPTTKTGRGYGKKRKTKSALGKTGTGFQLIGAFRDHSHDINTGYEPEKHMEKPVLSALQLSPRQKGVHSMNRGGQGTNMNARR